ncbi:hypothetical protein BpHYR1_040766 [Brachionus plicatilis]|uniref:Uncharacterized protein n=1 Tax=Brachionus plicatilis TaxID=10195 RepID=A0A3M7PRJ8_BRAPC|nr:hypothetical protein BpHYR1_040766 [Brachionus plicatilis]
MRLIAKIPAQLIYLKSDKIFDLNFIFEKRSRSQKDHISESFSPLLRIKKALNIMKNYSFYKSRSLIMCKKYQFSQIVPFIY